MRKRLAWAMAAWLLLGAQSVDRGDQDDDGISDEADRCAVTPPGAAVIVDGCSAADLVASPQILGEGARVAMSVAADGLLLGLSDSYDKSADVARRRLLEEQAQLDAGLDRLGQGDPCGAAETIGGVREALEELSSLSHELVLETRLDLQRQVLPTDPDADFMEVAFHELGYRASLVGKALLATRTAHDVAGKVCSQVVRDSRWIGIVERTEDAARLVVLEDGNRFVVPVGADTTALREGARVRVEGDLLADATGIAKTIRPYGRDSDSLSLTRVPDISLSCIRLLIAPFQPFHPPLPIAPNYVLHGLQGYIGSFIGVPVLQLEAPMRLATVRTGFCPSQSSSTGKVNTFRYSLKLEFAPGASFSFVEFASDLVPSDDPVSLPPDAIPAGTETSETGRLRVTEQVQTCVGSFPRQRCSSPVKPLNETLYTVLILKRGGYASIQYFTPLFALEDGDPSDFGIAGVQSFTVHPFLSIHPFRFEAEGYSPAGVKVVQKVDANNPFFAIFQDDFFDPDQIAGLAATGTDQRSGLRWPRIIGTRDGSPFWYSASLPFIVRDLVDTCSPGPHSFYRLPWSANLTKDVGQGNSAPFSHTVGSSQEFAFDFGLADGNTIRAARGGTVEWLTEAQTTNFNPNQPVSPSNQPFPAGSLQNWGNAVRIAHQDGTFSWYFHIKTNTVSVDVGDQVLRAQSIAQADNTGRSSGAHLHYQVQDTNANWGQSIRIRFDTQSHGACYIPVTEDDVTSNNN